MWKPICDGCHGLEYFLWFVEPQLLCESCYGIWHSTDYELKYPNWRELGKKTDEDQPKQDVSKPVRHHYPFEKLKRNQWLSITIPESADFTKAVSNIRSSLNYFKKGGTIDFTTLIDEEKRQMIVRRTI